MEQNEERKREVMRAMKTVWSNIVNIKRVRWGFVVHFSGLGLCNLLAVLCILFFIPVRIVKTFNHALFLSGSVSKDGCNCAL